MAPATNVTRARRSRRHQSTRPRDSRGRFISASANSSIAATSGPIAVPFNPIAAPSSPIIAPSNSVVAASSSVAAASGPVNRTLSSSSAISNSSALTAGTLSTPTVYLPTTIIQSDTGLAPTFRTISIPSTSIGMEIFIRENFPEVPGTMSAEDAKITLEAAVRSWPLNTLAPVWRRFAMENQGGRIYDVYPGEPLPTLFGLVNSGIRPRFLPHDSEIPSSIRNDLDRARGKLRELVSISGKSGLVYTAHYGWRRLSIPCLVVNGENILTAHDIMTPIIYLGGGIIPASTLAEQAEAIYHHGTEGNYEKKLRERELRTVRPGRDPRDKIIRPGSSIGPHGDGITMGTVAVRLFPVTNNGAYTSLKKYVLSAYHVFQGVSVAAHPANFMRAARLLEAREARPQDEDAITRILSQENLCGHVVAGRVGADNDEWREDWALIEVDGHLGYSATNEEITGASLEAHGGKGGIVGRKVPRVGGIAYKDGSRTEGTMGQIVTDAAFYYCKGTADPGTPRQYVELEELDTWSQRVVETRAFIIHPLEVDVFADKGDSGSAVLSLEEECWFFSGLLVSIINNNDRTQCGMFVGEHEVLKQIEEETGVVWEVL